jgi:hypothetical protein
MRFILMLFVVLVGCNKPTTSQTKESQAPFSPVDPKDNWFIVSWDAPPEYDRFGGPLGDGVATMRHHGNVYKVRCRDSYMMLKDPDIPQGLRHKARP